MNAPTVVACLTPAGAAAIATLAVRGPDAWEVCRRLFTPRCGPLPATAEDVPPGRFWLGRFGNELKDEVVLAPRQAQPVPWLELHCHGGREVLTLLFELFEQHGVRRCTWEEWQRQADVPHQTPLCAEAAVALAHAPTARTASILLDQYHGALERALEAMQVALAAGDGTQAERLLNELRRYADLGRHLTRPWRVVVAGAPNVGKSSLVNALAGYQRSVVSETPGTTRDVVTTRLAVEGWPVELVDTAGLRAGGETLEEQGIRLAQAAAESADLCLWVLDASIPPIWPPADLTARTLLVVNKIDLPLAWQPKEAQAAVRVSALTGAGIAELCEALASVLVPEAPPPGTAIPFTDTLCDQIAKPTAEDA
jgi:tRNA modification GTPase